MLPSVEDQCQTYYVTACTCAGLSGLHQCRWPQPCHATCLAVLTCSEWRHIGNVSETESVLVRCLSRYLCSTHICIHLWPYKTPGYDTCMFKKSGRFGSKETGRRVDTVYCITFPATLLIHVDVLVLVLVGWWTGSWSASVVHIFAVVAVVGVPEVVNWFRIDDFCRKIVPSIDHLTKEEFPWVQSGSVLCQFLLVSSEAMWWSAELKNCLWSICSFPVDSLYTSIMSPMSLLSSSEVMPIIRSDRK